MGTKIYKFGVPRMFWDGNTDLGVVGNINAI